MMLGQQNNMRVNSLVKKCKLLYITVDSCWWLKAALELYLESGPNLQPQQINTNRRLQDTAGNHLESCSQ